MKIGLLLLLMISVTLAGAAPAQTKSKVSRRPAKVKTPKKIPAQPKKMTAEYKILAHGAYSDVREPFVFVARDGQTYDALRQLVTRLPAAAEIDFSRSAVVAAFAGTKPTGGYSLKIHHAGGRIAFDLAVPARDMMVTQALTSPFAAVLVPLEDEQALSLQLAENWAPSRQTYHVVNGEFEYTGGLVFRQKKFGVEGTVGVWRLNDLVTVDFNLAGRGTENARRLKEIASGRVVDGKIELMRLDVGNFSENPKPPVRVTGTFAGERLTLKFDPLPTNTADGFAASGNLEAARTNK